MDNNIGLVQNLDQRVRREQLRLLSSHLPVVLPGSLLVAVLFAWGFWNTAGHTVIGAWLAVLVVVIFVRLALSYYFCHQPRSQLNDNLLKQSLLAGSFISGCLWGSAGLLFFDPDNAYGFALLVIVLGGLVAGSLGSHSYYYPNFLLFAIPEFLPLTAKLLLMEDDSYTLIALMMSLFMLLNLYYSKKYANMIEHSIRLQFANDALLQKLQASNRELHEYSYTDPLTGIGNRRQFDMDFEQTWQSASTTKAPVCLILMDVDHFKAYNDAYGHPQGDQVLKKIALVLLQVCEKYKVRGRPMRIGGEEFALLLKGDLELAANTAEVIREAVSNMKADAGVDRVVTASFGVAMAHPAEGETRTALFRAADEALYKAKTAGRNCVIVFAQKASENMAKPA
ncbi:diguanylate cyclase domain-containing protein [Thiolapillus sp.]